MIIKFFKILPITYNDLCSGSTQQVHYWGREEVQYSEGLIFAGKY